MQVTLTHLPDTAAEFEALSRRTPEEVCACFLCALNLYIKDKDAGVAAMDLLRGPRPMTPYDAQFLRDRLRGKEYLPLAYFEGAAPENSYTPAQPYVLNVLPDPRPQDMEPGYLRLFLRTAGADSPRPIKLRQKPSTGEWFLWEYSSPLSGIRIPAAQGEYRRAELRSPDPLCSPYLAFTLLIRAGLDGINRRLVLPDAADVNFYTAPASVRAQFRTLPETLEDAKTAAAGSDFIAQCLPDSIIRPYTR